MFQEYMVARAIHAEMNAKYNSARLAEGMTVEVLTLFDRGWLALRALLARLMNRRLVLHQEQSQPAIAR